ncbi:MAG: alpha/beta fold hydrolase [Candidatus Saccharimonadales bacterium]|jgi:pimeloyl-ACP methyl ester carboxylesterase
MFDYFWHGLLGRPYRLHSRRSGTAQKPVAILLHGIAASGEDWQKVLPYLETDYECITIDLLGFGNSPKPQWLSYTMDDHMRALHYTLQKLHLGPGSILLGHSLGSLLAARYASEHPKNVSRLILLSPPIYPPLDSIENRSARKLTGWLLKLYKFLHDDPRITPDSFKRLMYIAPLPRSVIRKPDTWLPFMRTLKECIEQQTILQDIEKLTLPIDICYGSLDQVVVGRNVAPLASQKNITIHEFINTHELTKRYGKLVGTILGSSA